VVEVVDADKAFIPQGGVLMRSDIEATDDATLLHDQHDRMYGGEGDMHYLGLQHQNPLKCQFLQIPYIHHSILTARRQSTVPGRCLRAGQFEMRLPHIPNDLKLTF
jgi:hypothetical protein